MAGLTMVGIQRAFAQAQAERAANRARIEALEATVLHLSERLAKVEAAPPVKAHL